MPTFEYVTDAVAGLPGVARGERHGTLAWFVHKTAFAWERPFTKADIKRFGSQTPPTGQILAVRTADLFEKEAVLAAGTRGVFDMEHFYGYPAYLIQLDTVGRRALREALEDAWLGCAPPQVVEDHLGRRRRKRGRPDQSS